MDAVRGGRPAGPGKIRFSGLLTASAWASTSRGNRGGRRRELLEGAALTFRVVRAR